MMVPRLHGESRTAGPSRAGCAAPKDAVLRGQRLAARPRNFEGRTAILVLPCDRHVQGEAGRGVRKHPARLEIPWISDLPRMAPQPPRHGAVQWRAESALTNNDDTRRRGA